jgi:predicted DNA-binding WGR domain protein
MGKHIYHCNEAHHNKYWEYTEIGSDKVQIRWGRVGEDGQSQTKEFGSHSERDRFITKKVAEKEAKGYKLVTTDQLQQEVQTAQDLGTQNKIAKIQWVSRMGNTLTHIGNYDPTKYVYVEVLNSWSKDTTRILLSKTDSLILDGEIEEEGRKIKFGRADAAYGEGHKFVEAVRGYLKRLYSQVKAVVSVKFAALGARKLSFGDDEEEDKTWDNTPAMAEVYASVADKGASQQVVAKFAAMGCRVLDL